MSECHYSTYDHILYVRSMADIAATQVTISEMVLSVSLLSIVINKSLKSLWDLLSESWTKLLIYICHCHCCSDTLTSQIIKFLCLISSKLLS